MDNPHSNVVDVDQLCFKQISDSLICTNFDALCEVISYSSNQIFLVKNKAIDIIYVYHLIYDSQQTVFNLDTSTFSQSIICQKYVIISLTHLDYCALRYVCHESVCHESVHSIFSVINRRFPLMKQLVCVIQ